jgi:hypothetical protein
MSFNVGAITGSLELDISQWEKAFDQVIEKTQTAAKRAQEAAEEMANGVARRAGELQSSINESLSGFSGRSAEDSARFFEERLASAIGRPENALRQQQKTLQQLLMTVEEGSYDYRRLTEELAKVGAELDRYNPALAEAEAQHKALELATRQQAEAAKLAQEQTRAQAEALRTVGRVAAVTGAAVLAAAGYSLKLAADAQETENLFRVSMGSMGNQAKAFVGRLNRELGIARSDIMRTVGTLQAMLTGMGLTEAEAYKMSSSLSQLTYDLSSFYNLPTEEAFQKIQSGIAGEIEPLRRLGVSVDELTVKTFAYSQGIAEQGEELTQQQKILARYGVIMQQTGRAQGDLERTQGSLTNQFRIFQQRTKDIGETLGTAYVPAASAAAGMTNDLLEGTQNFLKENEALATGVSATVVTFGAASSAIGTTAIAMAGLKLTTDLYNVSLKATTLWTAAATAGISLLVGGIAWLVAEQALATRQQEELFDEIQGDVQKLDALRYAYEHAGDAVISNSKKMELGQKVARDLGLAFEKSSGEVINFTKRFDEAALAAFEVYKQKVRERRLELSKEIGELQKKLAEGPFTNSSPTGFLSIGSSADLVKKRISELDKELQGINETIARNAEMFRQQADSMYSAEVRMLKLDRIIGAGTDTIQKAIAAREADILMYGRHADFVERLRREIELLQEAQFELAGGEAPTFESMGIETTNSIEEQIRQLQFLQERARQLHDAYALQQIEDELRTLNDKLGQTGQGVTWIGSKVQEIVSSQALKDFASSLVPEIPDQVLDRLNQIGRELEEDGRRVQALNQIGIQTDGQLQSQIMKLEQQRSLWTDNERITRQIDEQLRQLTDQLDDVQQGANRFRDAGIQTTAELQDQVRQMEQLRAEAERLGDALALQQANDQLDQMNEKLERAQMLGASFGDQLSTGLSAGFRDLHREFSDLYGNIREGTVQVGRGLSSDIGGALSDIMVDGKEANEVIGNLFESLARNIVQTVGEIAAQYLIAQALQLAFGASTAATAAGVATAWAPAAALASLATLGTNAIPAAAAISSTTALSMGAAQIGAAGGMGFARGIEEVPYTGMYKLHPGERVIPAYDNTRGPDDREPIVIENYVTGDAVAAALAGSRSGQRVVVNMITADAAQNGPARRLRNAN